MVAIAAGLLLTLIALCRRITRQAEDITRALDGARENTDPLWEVPSVNATVARITENLRAVREAG